MGCRGISAPCEAYLGCSPTLRIATGLELFTGCWCFGDALRQRCQEVRDGPNAAGEGAQADTFTGFALGLDGHTDGFEEAHPCRPAESIQNPRTKDMLAYFIPATKHLFKSLKDV